MNKLTNKLFALFVAVLIWQSSCVTGDRSEIEAQTLLDAGLKFDFTIRADGGTEDGGLHTGHGYKTSDGVEISTDRGLYKQEKNAKKDCDDVLKQTDKILKKERIDNGVRVVATIKDGGFVVTYRSGKVCNIYASTSLKHLLAFENGEISHKTRLENASSSKTRLKSWLANKLKIAKIIHDSLMCIIFTIFSQIIQPLIS